MVGEFCTGYNPISWNLTYSDMGMDLFDLFDFSDAQIIKILTDCCVSENELVPDLKKADWDLERILSVKKVLGASENNMFRTIGEYFALDALDYMNMESYKLSDYLADNYSNNELVENGRQSSIFLEYTIQ